MKKVFLWIVFLFIALFVSMKISAEVQNKILFLSDSIKVGFLNLNNNVINIVQRYFYQAEQIKQLSDSLRDKQQTEYLFEALKAEHKDLLEFVNSPFAMNIPDISSVRTISFARMNDYKKIWLEHNGEKNYPDGSIFGLLDDNKAAGIAILQDHRLEGFLNGDEKCSYSVVVGNKKSHGITKYDINKGFVVDYIPLYPKVEVGEIVYTSGYDNIFYPGILVGVVEMVELRQGYQIAIVKPASDEVKRFYWLVNVENPLEIPSLGDNATKMQDILESAQ